MDTSITPFAERVAALGQPELLHTAERLDTLQLNIGLRCNLACRHCHVEAGPERTEEMSRATMEACLKAFARGGFKTIDITGGAPELNPEYHWLVSSAAAAVRGKHTGGKPLDGERRGDRQASSEKSHGEKQPCGSGTVIVRTNLVILTVPTYHDLPAFWAEHGVEVVASLPSYEQRATDRQRGEGVFAAAIEGLQLLNAAGYGTGTCNAKGEPLVLNLVLNPGGAFLPPAQASAEREFKQALGNRYGVTFDSLLAITNAPGGRFRDFLLSRGLLESYMRRLSDAFNPATVSNIMCRTQLSVSWDGRLYDCDFNQAVNLPIEEPKTIEAVAEQGIKPRKLSLDDHCYVCCAGAGSSCGGTTA